MYYEFEISERLPGLNEYIKELDRNKYGANAFKRDTEARIGYYIMQSRRLGYLPRGPIDKPLNVRIRWYEDNARRDVDNILSAKKFIFDALQRYGVIRGDGQKYIKQILNETVMVQPPARVIVRLIEASADGGTGG